MLCDKCMHQDICKHRNAFGNISKTLEEKFRSVSISYEVANPFKLPELQCLLYTPSLKPFNLVHCLVYCDDPGEPGFNAKIINPLPSLSPCERFISDSSNPQTFEYRACRLEEYDEQT